MAKKDGLEMLLLLITLLFGPKILLMGIKFKDLL